MSEWHCADCQIDTNAIAEYYMVHDWLWDKYGVEHEMLCIACLEDRLGRELDKYDFTDCPLNEPDMGWAKSDKLLERLSRAG